MGAIRNVRGYKEALFVDKDSLEMYEQLNFDSIYLLLKSKYCDCEMNKNFEKILPLYLGLLSNTMSKQVQIFFKFLWSFQKTRTLHFLTCKFANKVALNPRNS